MLKILLRTILSKILTVEARLLLWRSHSEVVGITGSVGKTATKEAVALVLGLIGPTAKSPKSYNSELGVPLAILGVESGWASFWRWTKIIFGGVWKIIYPSVVRRFLVLELGVDRPGDIKRFVRWLRLDQVILTQLPPVPVHLEYFDSPAALAAEKLLLVRALKPKGILILNSDDPETAQAGSDRAGRVLTFGLSEAALVRGSQYRVTYEGDGKERRPAGIAFRIDFGGSSVPVRIEGLLGEHQLYPVLAAAATGLARGVNLVAIGGVLETWRPPPGRMRLVSGVKRTTIIDDSYNSSPAALEAALVALRSLEGTGRKIAVLGDMLELGSYTIESHRQAGRQVAAATDVLFAVGIRAGFILEGAVEAGMTREGLFHFDDARAAGPALEAFLESGDVVLVKGSQAMRLERVVEEVMAEPTRREELLCRQEPEWRMKS